MALINRFQQYRKATFVLTGNNQCIRTAAGLMSGNVFSTNTGGTTSNYLLAGSTAYFNMIPNSNVIFADLLWTATPPGTSVEFVTPVTTTTIVSQFQETGGWTTCMADVTNLVKNGGSGKYECNKINGSMGTCGWFLIIVYENQSFPLRYLSYVGGAVNDGSATITLTDIYTPKVGPIHANIFAGAYGSDLPDKAAIRVGPTASNLTQVGNPTPSGTPWNGQKPYNPEFAFLSNIICNCDPYDPNYSLLDTRGTFGSPNSNPYLGIDPAMSRAWMDIGSMDISSLMTNGQTQMVARSLITGSGWFTQNLFALQVDINSAVLDIQKYVDKAYGNAGDELVYTLIVSNIGSETANSIMLYDTLPNNATFVNNSLTIDGVTDPQNPSNGISLGSLLYQEVKTVTFKAIASSSLIAGDTITNSALTSYSFTPSNTIPTQYSSSYSNLAITTIVNDSTSIVKLINTSLVPPNGTVTYTSVFKNLNSDTITNIIFYDSMPNTTTFIPNSVYINGVNQPGVNPQNSIILNITLPSNGVATITFDIIANGPNGTIPNTSLFNYELNLNGTSTVPLNKVSNTVNFTYTYAQLTLQKDVDKAFSTSGDTITYSFTITNTGNIPSLFGLLKDTIPAGTTFISNSTKINGVSSTDSPSTGISVPSILPNEVLTITFDLLLN